MSKLFIAAVCCWPLTATTALAYCYEPSAPYCATSFGSFASGFEFDMCKSEMERYQGDVENYLQCLSDDLQREVQMLQTEAQSDSDDALNEYSDAVDSFNERAGG